MPADAPVVAVVPAAGEGSRLRSDGGPRKQFRLLGGEPVLVQTLRALLRLEGLARIVVAAPAGHVQELEGELGDRGFPALIDVVAGGATRQESVGLALRVFKSPDELVAVHDGVRPFLALDRLEAVVAAARRTGAAALAIPVADTLRRAEADRFGATVDRAGLWRMQTPQVFRVDLLRKAFEEAAGQPATDEVELAARIGVRVTLVEGDAANVKITTPADWRLAGLLWPQWNERISGK